MEAVGQIAREAPDELTMQAIAARAEIGAATAYRYFSTIDDVLATYTLRVAEELDGFSGESALEGRKLFDAVVAKWMELVDEHGAVMVRLRSRRGYLERLHAGDKTIRTMQSAWTRPVRELLDELGLPSREIEHALFLWNIIFDPREINDLLTEAGLTPSAVAARLTSAYIGALRGWSPAGA